MVAVILLLILSPVFLIMAILIKLEDNGQFLSTRARN